jgi:hypothetical protein
MGSHNTSRSSGYDSICSSSSRTMSSEDSPTMSSRMDLHDSSNHNSKATNRGRR